MNIRTEYRQRAIDCLQLANEAHEVYVKDALIELADEFRRVADEMEHSTHCLPSALALRVA